MKNDNEKKEKRIKATTEAIAKILDKYQTYIDVECIITSTGNKFRIVILPK